MAEFVLTAPFAIDMSVFNLTGTITQFGFVLQQHTSKVISWVDGSGDVMEFRGKGLAPVVVGGVLTDVTAGHIRSFDLTSSVLHYGITNLAISAVTFFDLVAANNTAGQADLLLSGADLITGTALADHLRGGAGQDTIIGGGGNDTVRGEAGPDHFVFNASPSGGVMTITDFQAHTDEIWLEAPLLIDDPAGVLPSGAFHVGQSFTKTSQHILYDNTNGHLYVDADGKGTASATVLFAIVTPGTVLAASDFHIYTGLP